MLTKVRYDIMIGERFYATLVSIIPYYPNIMNPEVRNISKQDIELDVIRRLPFLKNKNFSIELYE